MFNKRKLSKEHREKLRQAKIINPVRYWLGKKRPELKKTNAFKTMYKKGSVPWTKGRIRHEMTGKKHFNWKGGKPICLICKKKLSNYFNKYCSKHKGEATKGEKNYRYKGVTSKDRLERVRFRQQIQKKVFERDNYTCKICGTRGGKLQVDHIQSWAEYVELRFCINNCRTLCMTCHYKITFGKPMPPTVRAWGHNLFKRSILI